MEDSLLPLTCEPAPLRTQLKNESLEVEVARLVEELEVAQAKRARLSRVGSPPDALEIEPPPLSEQVSKESTSPATSSATPSSSPDAKPRGNRRFSTAASRQWRVDDVVKAARAAEKAKHRFKP